MGGGLNVHALYVFHDACVNKMMKNDGLEMSFLFFCVVHVSACCFFKGFQKVVGMKSTLVKVPLYIRWP